MKHREKELVLNIFYLYYCYVHVLKFCLIHNINIYIYLGLIIIKYNYKSNKKNTNRKLYVTNNIGHIFIDLKINYYYKIIKYKIDEYKDKINNY